jgi:hypothetical protein
MDIEFDKEKIKKYYYALAVGGATFVGAIILLIVINQMFAQSKKLTAEAVVKTQKLTQLQAKKAILDNLSSKETELKANALALSSALPEDKDIGRLFIQMNGVITDAGGSIKGIAGGSPSDTATSSTIGNTLKKYSFTLPVNLANYDAVKSLLAKAKQALRLMDVTSISMSSPDGGTMDANITINTYSRK